MIELFFVVIFLLVIVAIRNNIIYSIEIRRVNEVSAASKRAINDGRPWEHFYKSLDDGPSYNAKVFDLTKWTYRQFYPTDPEQDVAP